MKKSYHSIVVPIVDAMTAFRNCLLCSDAESPLGVASYVAVLAIYISQRFLTLEQPAPLSARRTVGGVRDFEHQRVDHRQAQSEDPSAQNLLRD
jgi:hypothetical protein